MVLVDLLTTPTRARYLSGVHINTASFEPNGSLRHFVDIVYLFDCWKYFLPDAQTSHAVVGILVRDIIWKRDHKTDDQEPIRTPPILQPHVLWIDRIVLQFPELCHTDQQGMGAGDNASKRLLYDLPHHLLQNGMLL